MNLDAFSTSKKGFSKILHLFEFNFQGNSALAEEVERLNERKSQLQKYNVRLEEENVRLKLEVEKLKSGSHYLNEL